MAPVTEGPFGRLTSGLRLVSRDGPHFRTGRWFVLAEGVVLVVLGVWGFVSAASHPGAGPTGAPVLILALTPWHSAVLLVIGLVVMLSAVQRHAAVIVTAAAGVIFVLLVFIGAIAAAHHAPGPLGLDNGDMVLHGVVAAVNFALLYWLLPDVLEGPDWVRRRDPSAADRSSPETKSPETKSPETKSPETTSPETTS